MLAHARTAGKVRLDPRRARAVAARLPQLATETADGIVAQITARAEAHAIRLALLYTLLDGQTTDPQPEHLTAGARALGLRRPVRRVGARTGATGDPLAEQIHAALRQSSRRADPQPDQPGAANHNQPAGQVDHALNALAAAGRVTTAQIPTGGRPAQLWTATSPTTRPAGA